MPSLEEIRSQIKFLDGTSRLLALGEIKELPDILWQDESIENIVQGVYSDSNGILVATNNRLVFVYKRFLGGVKVEDFPYDKISSIQYETGVWLGKITVFASGNKAEITHIEEKQARVFCEAVRARIAKSAESVRTSSTAPATSDDDVLVKLERLVKLKEQGALDENEFQSQKNRILGTTRQLHEPVAVQTVQEKGGEGQEAALKKGEQADATITTRTLESGQGPTSPTAKPGAPKRASPWFFVVIFFLIVLAQTPSEEDGTLLTDTQTSAHEQKVEKQSVPQPATASTQSEDEGEEQEKTEAGQAEPTLDITVEEQTVEPKSATIAMPSGEKDGHKGEEQEKTEVDFSVNSYTRFQVDYEERNGDNIVLSIDTDFPDEAAIMSISIRRAYEATDVGGHQDTFVVDYYHVRDEPLSKWKAPQLISLDDKAWKAKLIAHQDKIGRLPGMGFTIDDVDDNIDITVYVFEKNKKPRSSKALATSKLLAKKELIMYRPLKDDVGLGESRIVAFDNLKIGHSYILLKDKTPLMPVMDTEDLTTEDIMNALMAAKSLPSGTKIEVVDISYQSHNTHNKWYFVSLIDIPELQGWINSKALMMDGAELLYDDF